MPGRFRFGDTAPHMQDGLHRLFELAGAVGRLQGGDHISQTVAQKHAVVRRVEADAMVGHAVLRAVVRADLLGAVARADLGQTLGAFCGLLLGEHLLVRARRTAMAAILFCSCDF